MLLMPIVVTNEGDALICPQKRLDSPDITESSGIVYPVKHAGRCGGRCDKEKGKDSKHFRIQCHGEDLTIEKGLENIPISVVSYHDLRVHFERYNRGTLASIARLQG